MRVTIKKNDGGLIDVLYCKTHIVIHAMDRYISGKEGLGLLHHPFPDRPWQTTDLSLGVDTP